jgi:hypothetical protein
VLQVEASSILAKRREGVADSNDSKKMIIFTVFMLLPRKSEAEFINVQLRSGFWA